MLRNPKVLLVVVLLLLVGGLWVIWKQPPRLGLDLKGGTRLTLQATPTEDVPDITPDQARDLAGAFEDILVRVGERPQANDWRIPAGTVTLIRYPVRS